MKLRHLALLGGIFTVIISLLLFLFIVTSDDEVPDLIIRA